MMVRIFKTGTGSAKSAINYLMGKNDHTGKPRSVPPELLHGSPSLFQLVSNGTDRKHKYVSGAISFRDTEKPDAAQIQKIMDSFKASFLPGLKECENYADAWIAHRDKGNLELHFVVAGTEMQTGRQLNIHPPGKRNIEHFQAFTQVMNQAMGYYQVTPDPLKVALSEFEAKSKAGKQSRRVKTLLAKELHSHIVSGKITDRDELITHLEDNYGEVTRVGKDYISIRLPGSAKAKRLMGPLFQEGADYPQLVEQHKKAQQPQKLTAEEYTQAKATLEKLTLERAEYFSKRYKKTTFKRTINRKGVAKGQPGTVANLPAQKSTKPAKTASKPAVPRTMPAEANAATVASTQVQQADHGVRHPVSTPTKESEGNTAVQFASIPTTSATAIGMEMQLGSLANLVSKLMVKARTTTNTMYYEVLNAQIIKLQYQMAQLSLNLEAEKARASLDVSQVTDRGKPKI